MHLPTDYPESRSVISFTDISAATASTPRSNGLCPSAQSTTTANPAGGAPPPSGRPSKMKNHCKRRLNSLSSLSSHSFSNGLLDRRNLGTRLHPVTFTTGTPEQPWLSLSTLGREKHKKPAE